MGEAESAQKARACAIKGNINGNGEHIYHLPFQHFYPRVKVDEGKGERWFCTEQEARDAGWLHEPDLSPAQSQKTPTRTGTTIRLSAGSLICAIAHNRDRESSRSALCPRL